MPAKNTKNLYVLVNQLRAEIKNLRKELAQLKGQTDKARRPTDVVSRVQKPTSQTGQKPGLTKVVEKKKKKKIRVSSGGEKRADCKSGLPLQKEKKPKGFEKPATAKPSSKPQYGRVPVKARDVRVIVKDKPHWTAVVKTMQIGVRKFLITDTYGQQPLSAVKRMYVTAGDSKGRFTGHKPIWRVLSGAVSPEGLLKAQSVRREKARDSTHTKKAGPARRPKQEGAQLKLEKDKRNPDSNISKARQSFLVVCDYVKANKMAMDEAEYEFRTFTSEWIAKLSPAELADLTSAIDSFLKNLK